MEQLNTIHSTSYGALLDAIDFAARKHRDQRRKGSEASPYINHPIYVAHLVANVGRVDDLETLRCAILHDTVEDTETTYEELVESFGKSVADLVMEVTDDKSMPKVDRKRLQIEHSPHLSQKAQTVKLADKIANIQDVGGDGAPSHWDQERKFAYLDWAECVVAGLKGCNASLEELFANRLTHLRKSLIQVDR